MFASVSASVAHKAQTVATSLLVFARTEMAFLSYIAPPVDLFVCP